MLLNKITMIFKFLQGKKVLAQNLINLQTEFDLTNQPKGLYVVKISNTTQSKTFKLVVK